jgi:UDP-N-acetylglucosamine 1-carboxyvinyltransferase
MEKFGEKFAVSGGNELSGVVQISGAKNAVLPIMAAALLSNETCVIRNVPRLDDVSVMLSVLRELAVKASFRGHTLTLDCSHVQPLAVSPELLGRIRASNLILGPLLGRFKEAEIAASGGCSIGKRPMDLHFSALQALGARFFPLAGVGQSGYFAFAKSLHGAEITLGFPSVGATENLLMAAALAEGRTILHNAAAEPEIADLAGFINAMGGKVSGAGSNTLIIDGVKRLHGADYTVMPDRIETGTYLLAGALGAKSSEVILRGARAEHNQAVLEVLARMGVKYAVGGGEGESFISVRGGGKFLPVEVQTASYPGFPTDMQPQLVALLTLAGGKSFVEENIFENRFRFADELKKMGAAIHIRENCAIIEGVARLHGAKVAATDLRAGAALVLAGLAADGQTVVEHAEYIDRGYEDFEQKLCSLGADIRRISDTKN